ncbi:TPA: hypothetical protein P1J53_001253 [Clostridioides difficile]|uniref:nitroreductase family protein n=1 Tax=Clostridioides difficile TaxID=1496 RepID=UPI001C2A4045|nr:nitroreductase family protein [Clostridioides difficile]MCJ0152387.1 hypothetical protein [Clostridioides difficile]MCJ0349477.1 hypothetical protein [Clostridioides difficile]MDB0369659.1 hypothetical protein [Clostridioides difficile]MDB3229366.1 hypothetical protein [Clostridioides difficile]MDC9224395.1 nitroreductase family protein [Clostridioides difficile]
MELYEAIFYRKSVRNFSSKKIKKPLMEEIKRSCKNLEYLNEDLNIKAHVVDRGHIIHFLMGKECKVKAPHYIVVTSDKGEDYLQNIGFATEGVVLRLTTLGIATCWLEGNLKREDILEFVDIGNKNFEEDEEDDLDYLAGIKTEEDDENKIENPYIIIAFGYPAKNEELFRTRYARPDRKPVKDMINKINRNRKWKDILELTRRAPSVKNSQPWYFHKDERGLHLFEKRPKKHCEDMNKVSLGVALRHFDIACIKNKIDISYEKLPIRNKIGKSYFITVVEHVKPEEETQEENVTLEKEESQDE